MDQTTMLTALKTDLGIATSGYDTRLVQVMEAAEAEIIREGAATLSPGTSIADANLVIMYAAWLWRKRQTMEAMPRMVRWALNNRVFSEKGTVTEE